MIKQNRYLENQCSKTHSVQISTYSNTWTEWIGLSIFWGKKKLLFKVATGVCVGVWVCVWGCVCVCVCVRGQGGGYGGGWGWVCGCVNEVCMELTGCGDGCAGVGWVCVWRCGWVSEFWTLDKWHRLYVNTHYKQEYSVLNSIWPKVDWVSFGKTLQLQCMHQLKIKYSW